MKAKFGAIVVDGRGKSGGHVFSKNKGGNYMKNKSTPSNPQSPAQTAQRVLFGMLSQSWRGLSEAQRDSWAVLAKTTPRPNIFGDSVYLTGSAMFNKVNCDISKVGGTTLVNAPSFESIPDITFGAISLSSGDITLTLSNAIPSGFRAIVRATPSVSAGRYAVRNLLVDLSTLTNADGATPDVLADYTARFGAPVVDQRIGVSSQLVSLSTGAVGVPQFLNGIVQ